MAAGDPIIGVVIHDEDLRVRLAELKGEVPKRLKKVLYDASTQIEKAAKRSIAGGKKTGRTYKRKSVTHRASAWGEAPASDTGQLLSSIVASVTEVGSTVKHGLYLELGTKGRTRSTRGGWLIAPRPWLIPARDKVLPKVEANIIRELDR